MGLCIEQNCSENEPELGEGDQDDEILSKHFSSDCECSDLNISIFFAFPDPNGEDYLSFNKIFSLQNDILPNAKQLQEYIFAKASEKIKEIQRLMNQRSSVNSRRSRT